MKKILIDDIIIADVEANNWTEHIVSGIYDGIEYKEFFELSNLIEYILDSDKKCVYSHFGGIFDFLHFINTLLSDPAFAMIEVNDIIMQSKKILSFSIKCPVRGIKFFRCSSGLFPFSLSKLCEMFQVEHKKLEWDFSKRIKYSKKFSKYLEHDCRSLYEVFEKYCENEYVQATGLKLTRSGQTFDIFKKFFAPKLYKIPEDVQVFAKKAYFGGRVEIFKPLYKKQKKKLNYYDYNSMYPAVMMYDYPGEFKGYTYEYYNDCFGIYDVLVECPKDLNIPLLPYKESKDGKLIFPTGTFRGTYTNIELDRALEIGYKILKVYKGACFDNAGKYFQEHVTHFYNERLTTKNPAHKVFCKDMLNHLYGRMGLNLYRENITLKKSDTSRIYHDFKLDEETIRFYAEDTVLRSYTNYVLPTFVTSYARVKLFDDIVKGDILYCDTDGFFTATEMKTSDKLGDLKLETTIDEACFLLPKTYMYKKSNGDLIKKMKGFPEKNLGHIDYDTFVSCMEGEMKLPSVKIKGGLAGIKSALRKGKILMVLPDSDRQLKAVYDKRIIIKNKSGYSTIPHHIEHQGGLF